MASLTVLSRPHPNAFNRALQMTDGEQAHRSRHHKAFLEPDAADVVLADDARWLRERLGRRWRSAAAIEKHLSVLGNKAAMEAALAWYRARGAIRGPLGPIRVPTLFIWGDADDTVGRIAAEGTVDFVAAPYRFEVLPGVGHFAADQAPDRVSELLLQHIAAYPVSSRLPSLLLLDIPEHRGGRASSTPLSDFRHALGWEIFAERDIDHLIIGLLLDVRGDLLLLFRRGRARISIFQLSDLWVFRPAEPAAVLAPAADGEIGDRVRPRRRRPSW